MSSTRNAKDDSVFHQSRYASSPEFERGLLANLVARRCSVLNDAADRELVWFVQHLSHSAGGLTSVARELRARFDQRLGTRTMLESGRKDSQDFTAAEMRQIRLELPAELRPRFPLKGELKSEVRELRTKRDRFASSAEKARALRAEADNAFFDVDTFEEIMSGEREEKEKLDRAEAAKHPASYSVSALRDLCRRAAVEGLELPESKIYNLERELAEMCLNPEWNFEAGGPWYFAGLIAALREYKAAYISAKTTNTFNTALGKKVFEVLDYTAYCRGLTMIQGDARLGKSHAARLWCEQHPGNARFVEVPTGNDEVTFFRDLARGLGLGNFLNYKVVQIRERVEYVLRTGDIVLVLDEAQRLWPQTNFREGYPKRISWVMTMGNAGVPICMVSTPQFFATQKVAEKNGWNSAQLTGRISHFEPLPTALSEADLIGVAKVVLPEASKEVLRALAVYALHSARYLAAIDTIAKRARYIAKLDGRNVSTASDVHRAMKESVVPADSKLHCALTGTPAGKLPKIKPAPAPVLPTNQEETILPPSRLQSPAPADLDHRRASEFIPT
jgi:hypothetical protein